MEVVYMNDNFNQIVLASGKSLYEISFGTGIPYTTISQLHNNKRDINKVAAETIVKLALYFNKEVNDILNPISYISHSPMTTLNSMQRNTHMPK